MVAHQFQQSKPNRTCCVPALSRLRDGAGTAAALPCIIQCQAGLDTYMLVIPLVGLSSSSPWQPFPLQSVSLGPSLAHMCLSCSSPNTATNSCGVTIFRCLVTSVLYTSEMNVFAVPPSLLVLLISGCMASLHGFLLGSHWGCTSTCRGTLGQNAFGCWSQASAFA